MAGKRHDDGRVCLCDRPDGTCAGLAVQRLSSDRVQELAEEIWTASSGDLLPARSRPDPRSSRAGASAQAAYVRRRAQERERWRPALVWLVLTWGLIGAAPAVGLLIGLTVGARLAWPTAVVAAGFAWSRVRFRPSPAVTSWQRQAAMQRRTAGLLVPLADKGYLVLHDITLPGWLDSLEHLVVGPTGVWVMASWQRQGQPGGGAVPAGTLRELRSHTQAIAELLDGWARVPVRPLLCVHGSWPRTLPARRSTRVTASRRLAQVVRSGSPVAPGEVDRASGRLLEVLRPAA
jgi:hypothetical protein